MLRPSPNHGALRLPDDDVICVLLSGFRCYRVLLFCFYKNIYMILSHIISATVLSGARTIQI